MNRDDDPFLREVEQFRARAAALDLEMEPGRAEIESMLAITDSGAVVALFDERGLLESLTFDDEVWQKLEPADRLREINLGLARAGGSKIGGIEPGSPALEQLVALLTAGPPSEPVIFENDLKTVRVAVLWGQLASVDAELSWLAASPPLFVSEEIVRVARLAVEENDQLGSHQSQGEK